MDRADNGWFCTTGTEPLAKQVVGVRFSESVLTRLQERASQEGVNLSGLVRMLVEEAGALRRENEKLRSDNEILKFRLAEFEIARLQKIEEAERGAAKRLAKAERKAYQEQRAAQRQAKKRIP